MWLWLQYKDGKETELPGGVFTQTKGDEIIFHLALPEPAWYKFNIFAMPMENQGASLPNVYTYLIDLTKAKKPVRPYPKQFADWNIGCYLHKPLFLDTSKDLSKVEFKVSIVLQPCQTRCTFEAVPLVEFMYLVFLLACQVRVTAGSSGLCCCVPVTSFEC